MIIIIMICLFSRAILGGCCKSSAQMRTQSHIVLVSRRNQLPLAVPPLGGYGCTNNVPVQSRVISPQKCRKFGGGVNNVVSSFARTVIPVRPNRNKDRLSKTNGHHGKDPRSTVGDSNRSYRFRQTPTWLSKSVMVQNPENRSQKRRLPQRNGLGQRLQNQRDDKFIHHSRSRLRD